MSNLSRKSVRIGQRPALILVDLINGFTDPACPLGCECQFVIDANAILLAAFRANKLPIVYTTVIYDDDIQASVLRDRLPDLNCLTPGSKWIEVDPQLQPQAGEPVITKLWPSSFFKTDLDQQLQAMGADSLVVTGLTTSGCVRATALDGLQYNYPVFIPREAVGDRNPQAHESNLFDLHAKYTEVLSVDELLAQING